MNFPGAREGIDRVSGMSLKDTLDWVVGLFGYDTWDWGILAEWFAAIGTVLTLALGYVLARREIRDRREAHANSFTTDARFVHQPFPNKWTLLIDVRNSGDHTIYDPNIWEYAEGGPHIIGFVGSYDNFRLKFQPKMKQRRSIPLTANPAECKIFIEFTDVSGRKWRRSLDDGRYIGEREYNRIYWGTMFGRAPNRAKIRQKAGKHAFPEATEEDLQKWDAAIKKEAKDANVEIPFVDEGAPTPDEPVALNSQSSQEPRVFTFPEPAEASDAVAVPRTRSVWTVATTLWRKLTHLMPKQ